MKNTDRLVKDLAPKKFGKFERSLDHFVNHCQFIGNCCLHRPGHKRTSSN